MEKMKMEKMKIEKMKMEKMKMEKMKMEKMKMEKMKMEKMKMEKMKVGVIGAGAISDIYLKNMIHRFDALEVVAIASAHMTSAEKKAAEYGLRACTVAQMMEDPEIEMIVVLTPVGSHERLIRDALAHGKHVYTEKTLTDSPGTARALLRLAEEKGLYLGSAPDTFLGSAWQTARRAIDEGMLGEIHSFAISATRCNDVLLSLFSFLREPGCGILYDYAVYYITALVSLLGPVDRVAAMVSAPYPEHRGMIEGKPEYGQTFATPNESQVAAILRLKSGVTGTMHIDADTILQDEAYFTLYGTRGMLKLTDPNQFGGEVRFCPTFPEEGKGMEFRKLEPVSDLSDNCRGIGPQEMAEAIREGRPNRASKEMAYHVLEVLSALLSGGEDGAFRQIESTCDQPLPFDYASPFVLRAIRPEEAEQAVEIEAICFPPNEACKREHMIPRIGAASDFFLVAEDSRTGKLAGFINGIATNEKCLRDEFFTDAGLHDPEGENIMILGLDVLPPYRGQGLARRLVDAYAKRFPDRRLVLTCLERLVPMYEKFGFRDLGLSASTWGGEEWHEMERVD